MATMITEECINCGACEPECPNTAIYQGGVDWELNGTTGPALAAEVFYIVPEKCTECVGFHDEEACATVCPVDVCIPNPDIPETEIQLIERAKQLHPDVTFPAEFPSRFRAGDGEAAPATSAPAGSAPAGSAPAGSATVAEPTVQTGPSLNLPSLDTWDVPIDCYACGGSYSVAFRHLRSGNVLRCPFCKAQHVVTTSLHNQVAKVLHDFHVRWMRDFEEMRERRQKELDEFEARKKADLEGVNERIQALSKSVKAPGAPKKKAWIFG